MALQQLDLFGNPIPASKQEEAKVSTTNKTISPKKEKPLSAPVIQESKAVTTDDTIKDQATDSNQNQVVYSDSQIRVKIKPKKETVETEEDAFPKKKKRGRKKGAVRKNVAKGSKMKVNGKEVENKSNYLNIPDDETLNKKLYWGISEVAVMFGVANSLIRFWTNEFAVITPRKGVGSHRFYRTEDIRKLELIYDLIRVKQFSIDGARKYLTNNKEEIDVQTEVMQSLTKFKTFLMELKTSIGE